MSPAATCRWHRGAPLHALLRLQASAAARRCCSSNPQLQSPLQHQPQRQPPLFPAYAPDPSLLDPQNAAAVRLNAQRRGFTDAEIDSAMATPGGDTSRLPNWTHPQAPVGGPSANRIVRLIGAAPAPPAAKQLPDARSLLDGMRLLLSRNLSLLTGSRTHYLRGQLAQLEAALVSLALDAAREQGFVQIGVPELVPPELVNACGFPTQGQRSQVYLAEGCQPGGRMALIGTSEIALAAYAAGRRLPTSQQQLPMRLCAVSRCYRREVSQVEDALYRVPQFTKVELFTVARPEQSEAEHLAILAVQESVLSSLGLHCRLLDMATEELGSPAYRKFDWEAWLPLEGRFGELCSASNCTDYQSRRLDIRLDSSAEGSEVYAHTLNGTACAVTRTVKALVETHACADSLSVRLPAALAPYMAPYATELTLLRRPSMRAAYTAKLPGQPVL